MRVIARLDIKGPNVVKTVRSEGLRVIGDPEEYAKRYARDGADELIYIDIVASLYERNLDFEQLKKVSEDIFIPITAGGGIRSLHDIAEALKAGADKVAINTYAIRHPEFLREASDKFGAQCIVLSIEAKQVGPGAWEAYTDGGRERTGIDVIAWVKQALTLGIGEILLTSVDTDGTREGYDTALIAAVAAVSSVPVIAHGGAGKPSDARAAVAAGADAVSVSSLLHYNLATLVEVKEAVGGTPFHL